MVWDVYVEIFGLVIAGMFWSLRTSKKSPRCDFDRSSVVKCCTPNDHPAPILHRWLVNLLGFPWMGVALNHPFIDGIFHEISHPAIWVSWFVEIPICKYHPHMVGVYGLGFTTFLLEDVRFSSRLQDGWPCCFDARGRAAVKTCCQKPCFGICRYVFIWITFRGGYQNPDLDR